MSDYQIDMTMQPDVIGFFDETTHTISYIVKDPTSKKCAVIDSVMDLDYAAGSIAYENAHKIISHIQKNSLDLEWIIETHVHADHLSAAPYIQQKLGGKLGISKNIITVQKIFGKVFNEGTEFQRDGSQFDCLFSDGDNYTVGSLKAIAINTPGHTPACMTHIIGNAAFVGDTLFMPDSGSGRADFPGGDAGQLYDSIHKILSFPDDMKLFMCHDYGTNGREVKWETTVKEEKQSNIHVGAGQSREEFIALRQARDAKLTMPELIIPSLQVNMRAGQLPPKDKDGNVYLKVPVNKLS